MADVTGRQAGPGEPGPIDRWTIEELRAARAERQQVETGLSYLRRVVQGRLDIVTAELARRRDGGDPADLRSLVEELPSILADHLRAPGIGRLPNGVDEGVLDPELDARVAEAVVPIDELAELPDADLAVLEGRLGALEHEISERRRGLFAAIDELQAEITDRYRTGEADVESLLQ